MDEKQAAALRKKFEPNQIGKLPKAGVMLDFVGHAHVTDRLLSVDPEWSWEPMGIRQDGTPAFDEKGGLWIWLTICGVRRPGYGEPGRIGPKEAIGDAIRNAAMRFGVALDLWAKEDLESAETSRAATQRSTIDLREGAAAKLVTPQQIKKMFAVARGYQLKDDEIKAVIKQIADVDHTKEIPRYLMDPILVELERQGMGSAA